MTTALPPLLPSVPPALLRMRPHYVPKLWGGARLAQLPAKAEAQTPTLMTPPDGVPIGESWEVADIPEGSSFVVGGPCDGLSLSDVVRRYGRGVCGVAAEDGARFPLLVKILDAALDLSIQVHPDAAYASRNPGTFSKDEAWLVVDAAPGASVLLGTKPGVTVDAVRAAIPAGSVRGLLEEVRVHIGDVLHIVPGTIHAVGAGCVLLEVQEPSDTTFRLFDYNRTDASGNPRPLHVEQALAVARTAAPPRPIRGDDDGLLVSAARFAMHRLTVRRTGPPMVLPQSGHGPLVVFCLRGTLALTGVDATGASVDVTLRAGGSAVVVASAQRAVASSRQDDAVMIVLSVPEHR